MGYDDNWNSSKGEYWSLASMNNTEKTIYIVLQIWNIINILSLLFFGRRLYKRYLKKNCTYNLTQQSKAPYF